jgi:LCP family protein required for cell wall assembly
VEVTGRRVIVIGSTAATVATAALLQVNTLVDIISVHPGIVSKELKLPAPGRPQTILLIGSDHRYGASFREANTDTMLLVRLNAASSTINLMSIPRDLKVNVPEQYVPSAQCSPSTVPGDCAEKLNAAYSQGSYSLLIKTIKSNVFPDLQINHIVDTNFQGFSDLVDAIGCVYTDVDHRYYNVSGPGADNYSSIDIQPGYQRLCGDNQSISGALPFVRFRKSSCLTCCSPPTSTRSSRSRSPPPRRLSRPRGRTSSSPSRQARSRRSSASSCARPPRPRTAPPGSARAPRASITTPRPGSTPRASPPIRPTGSPRPRRSLRTCPSSTRV